MIDRKTNPIHRSRLLVVGVWMAGIAGISGLLAMAFTAVGKIRAGHGLDTYLTTWMVEDNWIGYLVFVVATTLVLTMALSIGWLQRYKERNELMRLNTQAQSKQSKA